MRKGGNEGLVKDKKDGERKRRRRSMQGMGREVKGVERGEQKEYWTKVERPR